MDQLTIIIQNNKPPQFIGDWTIGLAREALMQTLRWLDGIPLIMPPEEEPKTEEKGDL